MTMRDLREKANLQQAEVAKKLNVDQTAISNWERGKCKPSRKYHKKLAQLYGCTVDELLRPVRQTQDESDAS